MRPFCPLLLLAGILLLPVAAENIPANGARTESLSGPLLGVIHESNFGLRLLFGVPAAARLGNGPEMSDVSRILATSATRRYALGLTKDGRLHMVRWTTEGWLSSRLPVPGGAIRIAVSPSGNAALLVYGATGNVVAMTGIPENPGILWRNRLTGLPANLGDLALSDDGEVALAGVGSDGGHFLARITATEGWRSIGPLEGSALIGFQPGTHDAAVIETAANRASLLSGAGARWIPVAGQDQGVSNPVAVAFTADGKRLLVANANPAGVTEIRLADRAWHTIGSRWAPASLERLAGNAVFLLGKPPGGPLMLYDGDRSPQRVALVLAPRVEPAMSGPEGDSR